MLVVWLVSLLHICYGQAPQEPEEEKYVCNFDSPIYAYGEESREFIDTSGVVVGWHNETTAFLHGQMNFLKGMGSDVIMEIVLQKESSGGKFEVMFSHDICDFCDHLGNQDSDYWKFLRHFGIPEKCPIEPGVVEILDLVLDLSDYPIGSQHVGKYECELVFSEKTGEHCKTDRVEMCTLKMDLVIERRQ